MTDCEGPEQVGYREDWDPVVRILDEYKDDCLQHLEQPHPDGDPKRTVWYGTSGQAPGPIAPDTRRYWPKLTFDTICPPGRHYFDGDGGDPTALCQNCGRRADDPEVTAQSRGTT
jgi:hypothetical protein